MSLGVLTTIIDILTISSLVMYFGIPSKFSTHWAVCRTGGMMTKIIEQSDMLKNGLGYARRYSPDLVVCQVGGVMIKIIEQSDMLEM